MNAYRRETVEARRVARIIACREVEYMRDRVEYQPSKIEYRRSMIEYMRDRVKFRR